jgi:uncharacterized protein YecE (DUF72 family)
MRYDRSTLADWVQRVTCTWPEEADVFVYFNNDPGGAALHDAAAFASLIAQSGRQASRTWARS